MADHRLPPAPALPVDAERLRAQLQARYAAQEARNGAFEREARREARRALLGAALRCWAWCALGLLGVAYAIHLTEPARAWVFFWAGLAVGNGGMVYTILGTYRRGQERGHW